MSWDFQLTITATQLGNLCGRLAGLLLAEWDGKNVDLKQVWVRPVKRDMIIELCGPEGLCHCVKENTW